MERRSFVLTVPAVEFGEGRRMAAGQLGGAPEGRGRQTGDQRGVARLCRPTTEEQEEVKNRPLPSNKQSNKSEPEFLGL